MRSQILNMKVAGILRELSDVDPVKLAAARNQFPYDRELAERLIENPAETVETFVSAQWRISTEIRCEACGDPLIHGKCKRCDWGHWNNAMSDADQNPPDPTKDLKPAIQS